MITAKIIGGKELLDKFEKMGDESHEIFKEVVDDTVLNRVVIGVVC